MVLDIIELDSHGIVVDKLAAADCTDTLSEGVPDSDARSPSHSFSHMRYYLPLRQNMIFIISALFIGFITILLQRSFESEMQRGAPGFVRPGWARHRDNQLCCY